MPARILKAVELVPVDHMDEVLKKALVLADPDSLFKPVPPLVAPDAVYAPPEPVGAEIQAH